MRAERRTLARAAGLVLLTLVVGCREPRQAMYDQAKYEPSESSELFDAGGSARVHPEGTVARGQFAPADQGFDQRQAGRVGQGGKGSGQIAHDPNIRDSVN